MKISRFKHRAFAVLASTAMLLGVGVATATVASAHNKTVTATCSSLAVSLDSYPAHSTVKVTIDGDVKVDQQFTAYSNTWALDPLLVHPYTVKVVSADGQHQYDVNISDSTTPCKPDQSKVTLCHATGSQSNPYSTVDVAGSAVVKQNQLDLNGHGQHEGDIIPAFDYYLQNQQGSYVLHHYPGQNLGNGGAATLANGCKVPDVHLTAATPTVNPPTCQAAGSLNLPTQDHVTFSVSPAFNGAGTYTVTAHAADGYVLDGTKSWTLVVKAQGDGLDCTQHVEVNPAVFTEGSCDVAPSANYQGENNWWTVNVTGTIGFGQTVTITYTAKPGITIVGDHVFTHTFGAAPDCRTVVTPVSPTVTDQVCTAPGQSSAGGITVPATTGISYYLSDGTPLSTGFNAEVPGNYTVVAVPDPGTDYKLVTPLPEGWSVIEDHPGLAQTSVSIKGAGDCIVTVAPIAPSVTPPTCDAPGAMVPADGPTGVTYVVNEDGSVTATPDEGYRFDGESQSITYENTSLPQLKCVSGVAPSTTDQECSGPGTASDGSITLTAVEGITYHVFVGDTDVFDTAGGTFPVHEAADFHVTATADDGYTLVGETNAWDVSVAGAGDCLVTVTPVTPTSTQGFCISDQPGQQTAGTYTITATEGVVWTVDGEPTDAGTYDLEPGQTVSIVAAPAEGYTFGEDATTQWSFTDEYLDCTVTVVPTAPTFGNPTCDNQVGTYTIPDDAGVIYFLDNSEGPLAPGTYKVSDLPADVTIDAIPDQGYTFGQDSEEQFLSWSHSFASATPCASPTPTPTPTPTEPGLGMLPHTGGDVSGPLMLGGGLLGLGILLMLIALIAGHRREVRRQH